MNPPKSGKQYKEILKDGCGGYHDYWGEFDCEHGYEWLCDDCPIVIEMYKIRKKTNDSYTRIDSTRHT